MQVVNPGSGYMNSTYNLVFTGGGGSGANFTASTGTTNVVTGFSMTNNGSGYSSAPTVTLSGGGGNGASANATIAAGTSNGMYAPVYL